MLSLSSGSIQFFHRTGPFTAARIQPSTFGGPKKEKNSTSWPESRNLEERQLVQETSAAVRRDSSEDGRCRVLGLAASRGPAGSFETARCEEHQPATRLTATVVQAETSGRVLVLELLVQQIPLCLFPPSSQVKADSGTCFVLVMPPDTCIFTKNHSLSCDCGFFRDRQRLAGRRDCGCNLDNRF